MSLTAEQLFELLPSVYRLRDAALAGNMPAGPGKPPAGPLNALLSIIAEQLEALQDDLNQLYDDQFIETCAEWVVPYIGDLVGARSLYSVTAATISTRAQVAKTIRYRRRKGTVKMLEELARDVTGWPARAVEFFQLLGTTQYMNHLRPQNISTASLRDASALELIGTPFDRAAHTADVRRIAIRRGKYNISNIGLFLWRLRAFQVDGGQPMEVTSTGNGLYTFHPLGLDAPLYNPAQAEREYRHLSGELDVPGPLRRRLLYTELEARRSDLSAGKTPKETYFGNSPVFDVFLEQPDGTYLAIDPAKILICNLSGWNRPGMDDEVMVDPVLGRLSFKDRPTRGVRVTYSYAFSAPMGGGPYNRQVRVGEWLPSFQPGVTFQRGVTQYKPDRNAEPLDPLDASLGDAVKAWHTYLSSTSDPAPFGVIAVMDSSNYTEDLVINVPKGARLAIVAADWPQRKVDENGLEIKRRIPGDLMPNGLRPVLDGSISVTGVPASSGSTEGLPAELILDGLLVSQNLTVEDGDLGRLRISDCTLAHDGGGLSVKSGTGNGAHNRFLILHIENSILGPLQAGQMMPTLEISDSIISSPGADVKQGAIYAPAAEAVINTSTVFGTCEIHSLTAQDSIFCGIVEARRGQVGCVRYCYLPPESRTPRPYRCQPQRAASAAVTAALQDNPYLPQVSQDAIIQAVQARVEPQFNSDQWGDPDYAQLRSNCAEEIRTGAEDDGELGAFHNLSQPQRETNLKVRLEEYLRFGLETGIFYVS